MAVLLIQKLEFHTAHATTNRVEYDVHDIGGIDFLDFLKTTVVVGYGTPANVSRNVRVTSVDRRGSRGLLVRAKTGRGGLDGSLENASTGQHIAKITKDDIALLEARSLFIVPKASKQAYALHECLPGVRPGIPLVDLIHHPWNGPSRKITMAKFWVESTDQFLKDAELKSVEVRKHNAKLGSDGSANAYIGTIAASATAPRGEFFPKKIKEALIERTLKAQDFVGVDIQGADQQILDLKHGEVTKKYVIEKGNLPKVALQLADGLSDKAFVAECLDAITDCSDVALDSNMCS